jgi:hypothetical protein
MSEQLKEAEQVEVNGKTLKDWAKTEPVRLEKMFEHEFDEKLRAQMLIVYREYCMGGMSDADRL